MPRIFCNYLKEQRYKSNNFCACISILYGASNPLLEIVIKQMCERGVLKVIKKNAHSSALHGNPTLGKPND